MTFSCTCPACAHVNHVEWSRIGKQMYCGGCGKPFTVPAPMEVKARPPAAVPKDLVRFRCPACGKKYSTSGRLIGQKIRCKGCGGGVRVPGGEAPPAADPSSFKRKFAGVGGNQAAGVPGASDPSPTTAAALPSLPDLDRVPPDEPDAPAVDVDVDADEGHESVDDYAPMIEDSSVFEVRRKQRQEAVLSSRSEAMERVSREVAEEEARQKRKEWEKSVKKLKQKKKRGRYFDPKETLQFVAWVSAFVGVLAFLAWGYPEFRFPLGGVLCVTGFIVYLLGSASLRMLVAEEGQFKALVFRFFPPYQWWFVWTRWSEAKDFAIFFAAGLLIMSIGSAIIKISPTGKKAERAEKAYQKMLRQNEKNSLAPRGAPSILGIDVE